MKRLLSLSMLAAYLVPITAARADGAHAHPHHAHRGATAEAVQAAGDVARGVVYLDRNGDGKRDRGEPGIRGVSVSNGIQVVRTDGRGAYSIPLPPESVLFVSKPSGYQVPVDGDQLPQFYYLHYPDGTPPVADFDFPVIEPTGPLPARIDFGLLRDKGAVEREVTKRFKAMAFADTQASSEQEQDQLRVDIVDPLIDNPFGAAFGITVGDVVDDELSLYPRHNRMMAQIGIPMWNVPGNHDMNFRSPDDTYATETFKRVFGPTNYSFDYGDVHFLCLDNIQYKGDGQGSYTYSSYRGYLNDDQLEWIRNDLKFVDKRKLLVIATHIPLVTYALDGGGERYSLGDNINTANLAQLLEVIEGFDHVYGMAGHDTSNSWKVSVDHEHGWHGYPFIAHTLAEVRGNDWSAGPRDERGVRAATMQDGNPNGYYVMSFDGTQVQPKFMPASSNPAQAIRIVLDPLLEGSVDDSGEIAALERGRLLPDTKVVVNLFDGGERDLVEMSIDGGEYVPMQNVLRTDPFMERQAARYQGTDDSFSSPQPSSHIFEHPVAASLAPGLHTVRVRSVDEFGQKASSAFTFELVP